MTMMRDEEGQADISLYGVSYGTYLVNRILQVAPTLVNRAVFFFYVVGVVYLIRSSMAS